MGVTEFEIVLARPEAVYLNGEVIVGSVHLTTTEDITCRDITLDFIGGAKVRWSEYRSAGKGGYWVTFSNAEPYINLQFPLFGRTGGAQDSDRLTLPAGRHVYPFQFQLAGRLPSSFEGPWGRVRYSLKCNIDLPWKIDKKTILPVTICNHYDLNMVPQTLTPASQNGHKHLCCWCCKSGPISAQVAIDRTGYVCGELVQIRGSVENLSNRQMKKCAVELVQVCIFHATTKSRTKENKILSVEKGAVLQGQSMSWDGTQLHIPALPPSDLCGCAIISVSYEIRVHVTPSGGAIDLRVAIPIIIGTIPHQQVVQMYKNYFGSLHTGNLTAPPMMTPSAAASTNSYLMPPPPTYAQVNPYEEEKKGKHDEEDEGLFSPKYAVYSDWSRIV